MKGRPKKAEIGSEKWARRELEVAERRLRAVRRLIEAAGEAELPGLLRLETSLRRECERLARAAQPQPRILTDWPDDRELERVVLGGDEEDDDAE